MRELTEMIEKQTEFIFQDMKIAMKTCDWNTTICGTPVWRYFYHVLHSCDRWYINPYCYEEPAIHQKNLDKVDLPCAAVLTEEQLWTYYEQVRSKILTYLKQLTDQELYTRPQDCDFTRMELILGQYRHFMCHIGIFNGITIAQTGRYPVVAGLKNLQSGQYDERLYDE